MGGTTVAGEGQINGESAGPEGVRAGILDGVSVDLSGSYDGIGRAMLQVPSN